MHQRAQHSLTCVYIWLSTHWWHFKSLMLRKFGTFSGALICLGLEACVTFQLFQPTSQALPGSWLSGWGPSFRSALSAQLLGRVLPCSGDQGVEGEGDTWRNQALPICTERHRLPFPWPSRCKLRASCVDLQSESGEWMSRPVSLAKKQQCLDFCGVFLTLKIMIF